MSDYISRFETSSYRLKLIDDHTIELDEKLLNYLLTETGENTYLLKLENKFYEMIFLNNNQNEFSVLVNGNLKEFTIRSILEEKAFKLISEAKLESTNKTTIKSPMPGMVLKICKSVGDRINKGETVMILEAMKMENEIKSNINGYLSEIYVENNKPVEKNIPLFSIK